MPVKLNVGLSRKIGEPNYGSRGATINVELEADSSLVAAPAKLQAYIRRLFALIRLSLAEELAGTNYGSPPANGAGAANGKASSAERNGNTPKCDARPATAAQIKALYAIARRRKLDMQEFLNELCHADRPEDLTLRQASACIDALQRTANGATS